jgi:hypothetical protein
MQQHNNILGANNLQYIYVTMAEQRVGNDDNATRVLPNNSSK